MVVQPASDGFNVYSVICVVATLLHAMRDTLTRVISLRIPVLLITLSTAIAVSIGSGVATMTQTWAPVTDANLLMLLGASVFLSLAYYFLIVAMRSGEMSLVAPFRYSGLLFALLIGYVVWEELPNLMAWLGILLLVVSGLMILREENLKVSS
jgi:drug/metabolite transporter (DMT)-like permease